MDQYISHDPLRREPWKAHRNEEGVRRSIAYARRYGRDLTIFTLSTSHGRPAYIRVHPSDWDGAFNIA